VDDGVVADLGNLGNPVIVNGLQRWTFVEEVSRGSRGSLWAIVLLLMVVVMLVIVGVKSVACILISQFYAFRHVITKRLELRNTALKWLSVPPKFFFLKL
jgi:hypothetical protein